MMPFPYTEWKFRADIVVSATGTLAEPGDVGSEVWSVFEARYPGNAHVIDEIKTRAARAKPAGPATLGRPDGGVDLAWVARGEPGAERTWRVLINHVADDRQAQFLHTATQWISLRFLAHAPVQLFELSHDLRLEFLAPARADGERALHEDAIGQRLADFATPDGPGDLRDWVALEERLSRGEALPRIDLKSGDRHWHMSLQTPDSAERTVPGARHRGALIDGTELRRARERASTSSHALRGLINRIPMPMIVWNEHNRITTMNSAAAELAGVPADTAKGASILDVARIGEVGDDEQRILAHPVSASRTLSKPFAFTCGDGLRRWFRASAMPIDEGPRTLRATLYVDVTDSLERPRLIEQVSRLRSLERFASTIAHDLANVVTVFSCSVGVLERGDPDDAQEAAEDVRQALHTTEEMLKRLRQVASTHQERLSSEPVVVTEMVERAARLARPGASRAAPPIRVLVSPDAERQTVLVDALDLERALLNLLTNATDAAGPGGSVRVDVSTTDATTTITVEDDGPGIPMALRTRVCEPLFTTKGERGTGLGLSQVAAFVEHSGGRLRIGEGSLGGARLELELPIEPAATALETTRGTGADAPPRQAPVEPPRARRVLLADDHHAVRRSIARMFQSAAWVVDESEDAESAMRQLLLAPPPDLVVSDIVMPGGMDGLDLAQWCRDTHPDLPLILISGHAPRATDLERIHFLEKPVSESALMRLADDLVDSEK